MRLIRRRTTLAAALLAASVCAPLAAGPAAAQERDRLPTGVSLGLIYQTSPRDRLTVRPFTAGDGLGAAAREMHAIMRRDLDYSDRYEVLDAPERLAAGPVEYGPWNDLGLVWLLTGSVEALDDGYMLRVSLHDVVYGRVREIQAFRIPDRASPRFRMAVHAASDLVVRWTTGQPGMAASRIAVVLRRSDGGYDLLQVDSDGEGVQRIESAPDLLYSPAWSPDGGRMLYTALSGGAWELRERDMARGRSRVVDSRQLLITPTWAPNGGVSFAAPMGGTDVQILHYDLARDCCLRRLVAGPRDDLSPTYSPDGRRIAFQSNRLVQPHIYVAGADGGNPQLLSPYVYQEPGYYTSPDWSPIGSLVTFHGRSRGEHQIMVADADRPGATVRQITADGISEDPSWAPDGRHIVFSGRRGGQRGLFVIDSVTGRLRPLLVGGDYKLPDWSPALLTASSLEVRGR